MSDSDSDDEYGPITATWGSQTPSSAATSDDNTTETAGWDSLLDPNIKTGPNDLGSGNLHRRGTNFKPIDEELILARRLNIQVPKQKMLEAIRQTEKNLGLPEDKSTRKGNSKKKKKPAVSSLGRFSHRNNNVPPRKSLEPVPSTIRPPPPPSTNSNWLQSNLVDTPFWEKKESPTNPSHTSVFASAVSRDDNLKVDDNAKQTVSNSNTSTNGWSTFATTTTTTTTTTTQKNKPEKWNQSSGDKSNGWENYNTTFENVGWGNDNSSASTENVGWNNTATSTENVGWNNVAANTDSKDQWSSWASETNNSNISQWGSESQQKNNITTTTTNNIPSDKPSWLNSIPDAHQQPHRHPVKSPPISNISRFSNPTKQRYSDAPTIDVPKPVNYRKDVNPIPSETAPAPPPENSLLITINVELSDTVKIPVDIRELDDPSQLANEFGQKNNITAANVIVALTKLFSSQKDMALKKKQQKLQRRVPKYHQPNNVYTNSLSTNTRFSTYSSSPAYRNTTYPNTTAYQNATYQKSGYQNLGYPNTTYQNTTTSPSPSPFTRKAYY